jgi:hypothetical protein
VLRIPLDCHRTFGAKPLATRWLVPLGVVVVVPVVGGFLFGDASTGLSASLMRDPVMLLLSGMLTLLVAFCLFMAIWQPLRSGWMLEQTERGARFFREVWLGKRILHSREVDLTPYTWLRVTSVAPQRVTLELGNPSYQTLELSSVWGGMYRALHEGGRAAAIRDLCAVGAQVSAMTGITDRGFREMA